MNNIVIRTSEKFFGEDLEFENEGRMQHLNAFVTVGMWDLLRICRINSE